MDRAGGLFVYFHQQCSCQIQITQVDYFTIFSAFIEAHGTKDSVLERLYMIHDACEVG